MVKAKVNEKMSPRAKITLKIKVRLRFMRNIITDIGVVGPDFGSSHFVATFHAGKFLTRLNPVF